MDTSILIDRTVRSTRQIGGVKSGSLGVVTAYNGENVRFPYTVQFGTITVRANMGEFTVAHDDKQDTLPFPVPVESNNDWNLKGVALAHGERQQDYGHPVDNFRRIAGIWSAILDIEVTAEDVALCMIGVKISREKANHKADNLDDIDGYVACLRLVISGKDTADA